MHIRTPTDLGVLIKDRRRSCGWDQQTLADKIGTSRQWVIEIERGKPRAEVGLVLRALNALGVDLSFRTGGKERSNEGPSSIDIDEIVKKAREQK